MKDVANICMQDLLLLGDQSKISRLLMTCLDDIHFPISHSVYVFIIYKYINYIVLYGIVDIKIRIPDIHLLSYPHSGSCSGSCMLFYIPIEKCLQFV